MITAPILMRAVAIRSTDRCAEPVVVESAYGDSIAIDVGDWRKLRSGPSTGVCCSFSAGTEAHHRNPQLVADLRVSRQRASDRHRMKGGAKNMLPLSSV